MTEKTQCKLSDGIITDMKYAIQFTGQFNTCVNILTGFKEIRLKSNPD